LQAVDTNCLLRLITRDDPAQLEVVDEFLERAGRFWVSHIVLVETIWVLTSSYKMSRQGITAILDSLLENRDVQLQLPEVVQRALSKFKASNIDFSDALIHEVAERENLLPIGTFDKKLAKLPGTVDLSAQKQEE